MGLADHLKLCEWQDIECPCPGCNAVMPRILVQKHIEDNVRTHVQNAVFCAKIQEFEIEELREYNAKLLGIIHGLETASLCQASKKFRRVSLGELQYSAVAGMVVPRLASALSSEGIVNDRSEYDTHVASGF